MGWGWAEAKRCLANPGAPGRRREALPGGDPGRSEEHLFLEKAVEEGGEELR
jgi:hypothetical protein